MLDPRLARMARAIVRYSTSVRPGDRVRIAGELASVPLLEQLYVEALRAGGLPFVDVGLPSLTRTLFREGTPEQLQDVSPFARFQMDHVDVLIQVMSETNSHALSDVPPAKQSLRQKAQTSLLQRYIKRVTSGAMRTCITIFPTEAYASAAQMSLDDFEDFVFAACHADAARPEEAWERVSAHQAGLIKALGKRRTLHVTAPGTDLTLSVAGRSWVNCDGRINFPDGEIYTCPVEDSAEGHILFTYPACTGGREVEGVRLVFRAGRCVEASATRNEDYLRQMLDCDLGARFLGEVAVGTNAGIDRFSKNILFDEKIAGTCHLALGASAPGGGGRNRSAIHWDMVCDLHHGRIEADGEVVYRNGKFTLAQKS